MNKKPVLFYKTLVIGVIILFFGLSIIPLTAGNVAIDKSLKTTIVPGDSPLPPLLWTEDFTTFYILFIDPDGDEIFFLINWGDGTHEEWFGPYESGEIVSILHDWFDEGTYQIKIKAKDQDGESQEAVYSLTISPDFKFFHPFLGYVGITYKFTIYLDDYGLYMFDWGDGTYSDWVTGIADKSYSSPGIYEIKWKAKDMYGNETPWSDPILITILIIGDQPPDAPIIDGPHCWPAGKELCFTFHSTDPDNDSVKYIIDWGDGTTNETDFIQACTPVEVCHTWEEMGTYVIKAKAVDMWGAESDWSEFEITIPRTRATFNSLFNWFLERFLLLEKLLSLVLL